MRQHNLTRPLALAVLLMAIFLMCGSCQDIGFPEELASIYVSIVVHNEETPEYISDPNLFEEERSALVEFADMLHANNVMLNWQSDWKFLEAAKQHAVGGNTGGLNIVEYIHHLGFEVDPHAHESQYTYADVAALIDQLGVTPSNIAGGFVAYPPEECLLERFWQPIEGDVYEYTWQAEALWGGATSGHVNETSLWASGIWKPQDNEHFMVHDDNAPLPHIGKYGNTWEDLDDLVEQQQSGMLDKDAIYTAVILVRQAELTGPDFIDEFEADLQDRLDSPGLHFVGLGQLLGIWEYDYNSAPNQYFY
ncbi:MAG TPA: hypothetical protein PLM14_03525 [Candidatus Hydrogenedentes bacterium]|nr:hypothetical protein [Candidatus Hydrogenedentota bacterium]HQE82044.1 hypothetical protein [Candidatus Hydrogenedentota bacterium]HQH51199.1 hypothetical protein [Candidatus Hydrogenedentota bacterium]HQM49569.1 hypothetical protein [Candidatus Hydrogenedentota bacterium]